MRENLAGGYVDEVTFWRNVDKNGHGGCWLWTSRCRTKTPGNLLGYGLVGVRVLSPRGYARRLESVHRVSFELANGPIPPRAWILHRCDVPLCVNPDHLYAGDSKANELDKQLRNRHPRGGRIPGITLPRRELPTRSGPRHWNAKLTDAQVRELRERYFGNPAMTAAVLRREYHLSVPGVTRILRGLSRKDAGGPIGPLRPIVGEAVTVAGRRTTAAMVQLIRAAYAAGSVTIYTLAEQFDLAPQTVSKICRRESWRHVK